jgi:WD40 repeat protein
MIAMRLRTVGATCAVLGAVGLLTASGATANFPGTNGKIGFSVDASPGVSNEIATIDPDGQNRAALTGSAEADYDPSFSADGEEIVFGRVPQPANSGQIWTMNADGSGQTQLTAGTETASDFSPEFSPDGQWIVFDRYDGTVTTQVWIMRADGTDQTPLTTATQSSRSPSFSPTGDRIAFSRDASPPGAGHIWTMNPDGTGPVELTEGTTDDSRPSFSPDGERIVFLRRDGLDDSIWIMNADGSGETPVTSLPQLEEGPVFSPDGTRIAFYRSGPGDNLFLIDPDGSNLTPVPFTADAYGQSSVAWQPLNPPSCDLSGDVKQKSLKQVIVTVTCANENATVAAEGTGKAPKPKAAVLTSKARTFAIPAVTAQVPAATPTTITLGIPKQGRKALKKAAKAGKKGRATIATTATDDFGETTQDSLAVKFKKKKKK